MSAHMEEGQGHQAIERKGTPEGVVGNPKLATRKKKRPIAAILKYLALITAKFRKYPPENFRPSTKSLRTPEEMEPF